MSATKRRRICPPDFQLTVADEVWARVKYPHIDVLLEFEQFKDHEYAQPKSDWSRCFRNWIRNADKFARRDSSLSKEQRRTENHKRLARKIERGEV